MRAVCDFVLAEAAEPPDEALVERVAKLEERLRDLTHELQQRRQTIPNWIAQRLDEQNKRAVVLATTADADEAPAADADSAPETRLGALLGELHRCGAVSSVAEQLSGDVQRSLQQASELAAQLSTMQSSIAGCMNATELAILQPPADKENQTAASMLRKRREVAQSRSNLVQAQETAQAQAQANVQAAVHAAKRPCLK